MPLKCLTSKNWASWWNQFGALALCIWNSSSCRAKWRYVIWWGWFALIQIFVGYSADHLGLAFAMSCLLLEYYVSPWKKSSSGLRRNCSGEGTQASSVCHSNAAASFLKGFGSYFENCIGPWIPSGTVKALGSLSPSSFYLPWPKMALECWISNYFSRLESSSGRRCVWIQKGCSLNFRPNFEPVAYIFQHFLPCLGGSKSPFIK